MSLSGLILWSLIIFFAVAVCISVFNLIVCLSTAVLVSAFVSLEMAETIGVIVAIIMILGVVIFLDL